jgi:hypothetical protein
MLFSGYFVNQDNIPIFLKPFEYVSLFKYGFQVFVYNEYKGIDINCPGREDPVAELNFSQTKTESAIAILAIGIG